MLLSENATIRSLLPRFCEEWERDFTVQFPKLRASGDTEGIRRMGHTVKGSFAQFGVSAGSPLGEALMRAAAAGDWDAADAVVADLFALIQQVKAAIARG